MAGGRKFRVPHLPPIVLWGTITGLMALGVVTTLLDFSTLPREQAMRASKQKQAFVIDAVSGEVKLGDTKTTAEMKPAELAATEAAPAPEPMPEPAVETPPAAPAEVTATMKPEEKPVMPAPTTSAATPPATPEKAATPAPAAPSPGEKTAAAPAATAADPALPKGTPALRTEPLTDALTDQPRTKESLTPAPAPEITETVDGVKVPKRGDHDIVASALYAHPFKREADQVLISFVILNTGLDPQSIGLAMALPPEVSVAYSPYTKPGMAYSENVRALGHEVWTMLPAMGEHYPSDDPGPMGIIGKMPPEETARRVREAMGSIPGAVGLVLPPDEIIVQQKDTMAAALNEISTRGMLLMAANPNHTIDQITTKTELAAIIRRADIILDPTPNESQIKSRLAGLLDAAKDKGELVVVLSSRPQSLQILSDWLQETKLEAPFVLAPLSAIYEPKEATVVAPPANAGGGEAKKPKPAAKPKPKALPQDQYESKATDKKPEAK